VTPERPDGERPLWVFAYGSLMWRPGFVSDARLPATLVGYRRCFCIYSVHHRGSPRRPGLVLGLDRGGSCRGVAYRVPASASRGVLAYLRAREQINGVYRACQAMVDLDGTDTVSALCYVAERAHPSYAGRLSIEAQARLIRAARGRSGTNLAYLASTLAHLRDLGFRERELERVAVATGPLLLETRGANGEPGWPRAEIAVRVLATTPVGVLPLRPTDRRRFVHRLSGDIG
jgi:cation transport protein ChaC